MNILDFNFGKRSETLGIQPENSPLKIPIQFGPEKLPGLNYDQDKSGHDLGEGEGRSATHAPAVEVIDHATWSLLQRLQANGVIQFVGTSPRQLHQSAAIADDPAVRLAAARAAELRSLAERQLRKAQVLAAAGFAEELPALISASIGHGAAARLALLGELVAGSTSATQAQVRDLVARQQLPARAAEMVDRLSATAAPSSEDAERLLTAAAEIVSACTRSAEPLPLASNPVLPAPQVRWAAASSVHP
jgi:hypothetical protein